MVFWPTKRDICLRFLWWTFKHWIHPLNSGEHNMCGSLCFRFIKSQLQDTCITFLSRIGKFSRNSYQATNSIIEKYLMQGYIQQPWGCCFQSHVTISLNPTKIWGKFSTREFIPWIYVCAISSGYSIFIFYELQTSSCHPWNRRKIQIASDHSCISYWYCRTFDHKKPDLDGSYVASWIYLIKTIGYREPEFTSI